MIPDPVQRRVAEGEVRHLLQVELVERGLQVVDPPAEVRLEVLAGGFEHICRAVNRDQSAVRQAPQEKFRQSAAATAEVKRGFVATQRQALDHRFAPRLHRVAQAVVGARVPLRTWRRGWHGLGHPRKG